MVLAPQVLKLDSNNYELRIELLKILIANAETMPQALTEMHRLDAQLKLKFMGQQHEAQEVENERIKSEVGQMKLRI